MKSANYFLISLSVLLFSNILPLRSQTTREWTVVASYTIPGKASGLAWDGGIEDMNGDNTPDVVAGSSNNSETIGMVYGISGDNGAIEWSYGAIGSSVLS